MSEMKLKKLNDTAKNELSCFVNTIYDIFVHEIKNLEDSLKTENDPLHYLLLKTRLDTIRDTLKMYDNVVDSATEFTKSEPSHEESETPKEKEKKYLKWGDIDFQDFERSIKVKLNDVNLILKYQDLQFGEWAVLSDGKTHLAEFNSEIHKSFFDNLHLEVIENE